MRESNPRFQLVLLFSPQCGARFAVFKRSRNTALAALLILLAVGIAWTVTRHLRKDWYPSHIIGLGLLILVLLVAAIGYGGARYERGHVNRGEVE